MPKTNLSKLVKQLKATLGLSMAMDEYIDNPKGFITMNGAPVPVGEGGKLGGAAGAAVQGGGGSSTDIKKQRSEAKKGTHKISFQPGQPAKDVEVVKFKGDRVVVKTPDGEEVTLNNTASKKLLEGGYRGEGKTTPPDKPQGPISGTENQQSPADIKKQRSEAKKGTHKISFQPGQPAKDVEVVKFKGDRVVVKTPDGEVTLNNTASKKLLEGGYR